MGAEHRLRESRDSVSIRVSNMLRIIMHTPSLFQFFSHRCKYLLFCRWDGPIPVGPPTNLHAKARRLTTWIPPTFAVLCGVNIVGGSREWPSSAQVRVTLTNTFLFRRPRAAQRDDPGNQDHQRA